MKTILRHYVIDTVSLYLVSRIASGLVFEKGMESLLLTGAALALVSILAKPIINLLLLPLNLITFGLFRWISGVVALYLVTILVPGFKIAGFASSSFLVWGFQLPAFAFAGISALIAFSFLISLVTSLVYWLVK
ncbi:phage holin family protein [Candidatus Woesebacteria bacterium]|nr:phage holin family protein [Candidatus Woesebacteria bacterium]